MESSGELSGESAEVRAPPPPPTAEALSREELCEFLAEKEGSVLRAWLKHFDQELLLRVTPLAFSHGMEKLGLSVEAAAATFNALDEDKSGDVPLEEIDEVAARLWQRFREWAAGAFESSRDMVARIAGIAATQAAERTLSASEWTDGLRRFGWTREDEELLFEAQDHDGAQALGLNQLKWLDVERRRQRRKEQAKAASVQFWVKKLGRNHAREHQALNRFKQFLKRTYGNYIRAWRCALSPHDQMVIQRTPFYKACADLGFKSEVKLIWHGFGKNEEGRLSMDELDSRSAVILATFKVLIDQKFGGAAGAFRALDRTDVKKVREADFLSVIHTFGFEENGKLLFKGLDRAQKRYLVQEDIMFLDRWRPPEFLTVVPNPTARDDIKHGLLHKYKRFLKAWRRTLDPEGKNRCDWPTFLKACRKIGYHGDRAGAWRSLDRDMSGYISLNEIDPLSCETLRQFRAWADQSFGCTRSAFTVFDDDGSNGVSKVEFRKAARIYGYEGDAKDLFDALDVENSGQLSVEQVAFLDDWEFEREKEEEEEDPDEEMQKSQASRSPSQGRSSSTPRPQTSPCTLGGGVIGTQTPRVVPEPPRNWWHELPSRNTASPDPGATPVVVTMWCSWCRARGPCRHQLAKDPPTFHGQRWSASRCATPSSWRPFDSVEGGAVASVFPTAVDGTMRAEKARRRLHEAFHSAKPPLQRLLQCAVSPEYHAAQPRGKADQQMSVQLEALSHFPIGSVSPAQAAQVLATLRSAAAGARRPCGDAARQATTCPPLALPAPGGGRCVDLPRC